MLQQSTLFSPLVGVNPVKATLTFCSSAHHRRRPAGGRLITLTSNSGRRGLTWGVCQTFPMLKSTFRSQWKQQEMNSTCLRLTWKRRQLHGITPTTSPESSVSPVEFCWDALVDQRPAATRCHQNTNVNIWEKWRTHKRGKAHPQPEGGENCELAREWCSLRLSSTLGVECGAGKRNGRVKLKQPEIHGSLAELFMFILLVSGRIFSLSSAYIHNIFVVFFCLFYYF